MGLMNIFKPMFNVNKSWTTLRIKSEKKVLECRESNPGLFVRSTDATSELYQPQSCFIFHYLSYSASGPMVDPGLERLLVEQEVPGSIPVLPNEATSVCRWQHWSRLWPVSFQLARKNTQEAKTTNLLSRISATIL